MQPIPNNDTLPHSDVHSKPQHIRLDYLDGLRGIAAIYVVLGHIYVALRFFSSEVVLPDPLLTLLSVFNIGQTAVDVFIVLSGYCLMLPVVRANGELRGGLLAYVRRRAVRILPPYYAALVFSLILLKLTNAIAVSPPSPSNDFRLDVVLAHIFLVHNVNQAWIYGIDPPMWSVAVEWQIYFLFPLVLLPIWRRCGTLICIAAAFAVGLAPHFLLNGYLDWSFPWFIGLFTLGMTAAVLNFSPDPKIVVIRQRVPWGWLSLLLWSGIIGYCLVRRGWYSTHQWVADPIIGFATMCMLVACTRQLTTVQTGRRPVSTSAKPTTILRILASRWACAVGTFSYSIYLIHYPVMVCFWHLMMGIEMSALMRAGVMYGIGLPLIMALSYLFHLSFERHFMPGHLRPEANPGRLAWKLRFTGRNKYASTATSMPRGNLP